MLVSRVSAGSSPPDEDNSSNNNNNNGDNAPSSSSLSSPSTMKAEVVDKILEVLRFGLLPTVSLATLMGLIGSLFRLGIPIQGAALASLKEWVVTVWQQRALEHTLSVYCASPKLVTLYSSLLPSFILLFFLFFLLCSSFVLLPSSFLFASFLRLPSSFFPFPLSFFLSFPLFLPPLFLSSFSSSHF